MGCYSIKLLLFSFILHAHENDRYGFFKIHRNSNHQKLRPFYIDYIDKHVVLFFYNILFFIYIYIYFKLFKYIFQLFKIYMTFPCLGVKLAPMTGVLACVVLGDT